MAYAVGAGGGEEKCVNLIEVGVDDVVGVVGEKSVEKGGKAQERFQSQFGHEENLRAEGLGQGNRGWFTVRVDEQVDAEAVLRKIAQIVHDDGGDAVALAEGSIDVENVHERPLAPEMGTACRHPSGRAAPSM